MATGSTTDILARLKSYLPRGWFGDYSESPIIVGVMTGTSSVMSVIYTLIMFFWAQTRLQTSSGGWVDIWASDFLGSSLPRHLGETDAAYILRIQSSIFQQHGTRPGMISALTALTGRAPVIFEPANPYDSGCFGKSQGVNSFYGVARFGSIASPFSALITAYRPQVSGSAAGAAYYDAPVVSAFHTNSSNGYFGSLANENSIASDASIYTTINATRPIATNIGVSISN